MGYDDKISSRLVRREVEIETPMGLRTFTYGSWRGDSIEGKYRGQEVSEHSRERLLRAIEKIEEEFQSKQAKAAARKEVAKSPPEATLMIPGGYRQVITDPGRMEGYRRVGQKYKYVWESMVLEEIHVRGIDQRSGDALITRADGTREGSSWGPRKRWGKPDPDEVPRYSSGQAVLLPLEQTDRADLIAADRAIHRAQEALKAVEPTTVGAFQETLEEITLEISYDPETDLRKATYDGQVFTATKQRGVEGKVMIHLLIQAGYTHMEDSGKAIPLEDVAKQGDLWISDHQDIYRSVEEIEVEIKAKAVVKEAEEVFRDIVTDLLFDKSLLGEDA